MTRFLPTLKSSTWILILGMFVGLSVLLWPEFAHAAEDTNMLAKILYQVVLNLTGWMLFVGGMLLDYGINTFVINFGTVFNSNGVGEAVNQLWAMVRDLFNILFIFGLVYIGFKMILNSDDSRTKSTLISLIVAALLMNFSLFITKFVVDFSNILASEVALAGFENTNALGPNSSSISVGNTFFDLMGVAGFLESNKELNDGQIEPWSFIFGIGIINIIGAFAFGVGGIMLIIRFIALSVYMVLSPFMFLGWIFPGFQSMSQKYWSGFFKQAFYAPVYIVMVFFSATILRNFFGKGVGSAQDGGLDSFGQQGANTFGTVTGDVTAVAADFAGGLGPFILSAGFLIAAVQVAGKLSADGSGIMAKVTGGVNARVRGAVRGGARFTARNTAGYGAMAAGAGANKVANSRAYRRLNTGLGNSIVGRNVAAGMDATLAKGGRASIAGSRTAAEQSEVTRARQNQVNSQRSVTDREDALKKELTDAQNNSDINVDTQRKNRRQAINALGGKVAKMSDAEILAQDKGILTDPAFAQHLKEGHIKALKESGIYDNDTMKEITDSRNTASIDTLSETLDSNNATAQELNDTLDQLAQTIQRMPTERVQDLGIDRLKEQRVASNLSTKQIEDLGNSGRYTASQIQEIKNSKKAATLAVVNGHAPELTNSSNSEQMTALSDRRERLFKASAQDAGKLDADIFKNPTMAQYITPAALQQRVRNGLSNTEIQNIENNINQHISASGDIKMRNMWTKWSSNTTEGARFNIV